MENFSEDLVAVEELFLAVQIFDSDTIIVVDGKAIVDLAEFHLTPEEIEKFKKIFRKLNHELSVSLQKHHPASSVISEIRSKSGD
jgi:5,10-methenyltetrahydromethanopterin hydrogenase